MKRHLDPFFEGMASALDLFGVLYDPPELRAMRRRARLPPQVADREAFRSDGRALAGDWERVMRGLEEGDER